MKDIKVGRQAIQPFHKAVGMFCSNVYTPGLGWVIISNILRKNNDPFFYLIFIFLVVLAFCINNLWSGYSVSDNLRGFGVAVLAHIVLFRVDVNGYVDFFSSVALAVLVKNSYRIVLNRSTKGA